MQVIYADLLPGPGPNSSSNKLEFYERKAFTPCKMPASNKASEVSKVALRRLFSLVVWHVYTHGEKMDFLGLMRTWRHSQLTIICNSWHVTANGRVDFTSTVFVMRVIHVLVQNQNCNHSFLDDSFCILPQHQIINQNICHSQLNLYSALLEYR